MKSARPRTNSKEKAAQMTCRSGGLLRYKRVPQKPPNELQRVKDSRPEFPGPVAPVEEKKDPKGGDIPRRATRAPKELKDFKPNTVDVSLAQKKGRTVEESDREPRRIFEGTKRMVKKPQPADVMIKKGIKSQEKADKPSSITRKDKGVSPYGEGRQSSMDQ